MPSKTPPDIAQWIASESGQGIIRNIAEHFRETDEARLIYRNFSKEQIHSELVGELKHFLLLQPDHLTWILTFPDPAKTAKRLYTAFRNHLKSRARVKSVSPTRYLYRRLREIMGEGSGKSLYRTSRKIGSKEEFYYSLDPEAVFGAPLALEDMKEVNFPFSMDASVLGKRENLLEIAIYFWNEIRVQWSRPVWIKIFDLIDWIKLHVPLSSGEILLDASADSSPEGSPLGEVLVPPGEMLRNLATDEEAGHYELEEKFSSYFPQWADCFVGQLSEKEAGALFLKLDNPDVTLKEMARKLGYKGESGPSYPLERAMERLRDFCAACPGLSEEDRDTDFFWEFMKKVSESLKKKISGSLQNVGKTEAFGPSVHPVDRNRRLRH